MTIEVKVKLNETEKQCLIDKVKDFTEGGFCKGIDCSRMMCFPECPLYDLDNKANSLRKAVLNFVEKT